eukprot:scaffold325206_cov16-Prasinocladus_malaysianus.AAC.1
MGGDAEGGAGCNLKRSQNKYPCASHGGLDTCFFAPVVDVVIGIVVVVAVSAVNGIAANSCF